MNPIFPLGLLGLLIYFALKGKKAQGAELELKEDLTREIEKLEEAKKADSLIETSPIPEASASAWWAYFKGSRRWPIDSYVNGPKEEAFGAFHFGTRTLADLGLMVIKSQNGRVVGEWVPPLTRARFLSEPALQYAAFAKQAKAHRSAILARHKSSIGKELEGMKVTLSGMMGLSQSWGLGTLAKWLAEPATRKPDTTALVRRYTGIF